MTTVTTLALGLLLPLTSDFSTPPEDKPVQVFILAGQSNMEGKAKVSLLEYQLTQPGTKERFAHLRDGDVWVERSDVWIKFQDRNGKLKVGYGSPDCVGPELAFGHTVGDAIDAPVVIIKTAWGGKSLFRDFRPPSAGLPDDEVLERNLANEQKRNPERTLDEVKQSYGHFYRLMLADVAETLTDIGDRFPELKGQQHELAGFVWFQGWNDMVSTEYTAAYADNMSHFIRDVREDLAEPDLPFVIGQLGVGGTGKQDAKREAFKAAQAAPMKLKEFQSNVRVVHTDAFWDDAASAVFEKGWKDHVEEWEKVGSDYPYHYLGSHKTMAGIGNAFGEAVLELRAKR